MTKPATKTRRNGTVRCTIYTRKSSEEGLDQEFNSLQAQRKACETFINSQRHEGWVCRRAVYDDGGFSGATMDRPAPAATARRYRRGAGRLRGRLQDRTVAASAA
jgi:DNA invertase Pin-like site-specific DNA recombinase